MTYCRICEAACGLTVERNEDGEAVRLRPYKEHPISQGFVCAKGLRFLKTTSHPDRLLHPQMRQGDGSFTAVSWQTAHTHIQQKLSQIIAEHGPHAVGIYFGTPLIHNGLGILSVFQLARTLGTRNLYSAGTQDNSNKLAVGELVHGSAWIQPITDVEHCDLLIMLGTNPVVSQSSYIHLEGGSTAYDRLLERGGRIVVVDPRYTESAKRWAKGTDDFLPIHPGTDIFLLLALINELRDLYQPHANIAGAEDWLVWAAQYPIERAATITHLAPSAIQSLAAAMRKQRTTFLLSVGVNQGPFATSTAVAMQFLAYLTGNFDVAGGLLFQSLVRHLDDLLSIKQQDARSRIGNYPLVGEMMPSGILADEILEPHPEQIRALLVFAGNPLTSIPNEAKLREAFSRLELLVTHDLFVNETAELAHIQLPATSFLERTDWAAWQMSFINAPFLPYAPASLQPAGKARTEAQVMGQIALDLKRPYFRSRLITKRLSSYQLNGWMAKLFNITFWPWRKKWQADGIPYPRPKPGYLRKNKVNFWPQRIHSEPARVARWLQEQTELKDNQLRVLGRRRRRGQNSWLHNGTPNGNAEDEAWLDKDEMMRLGLVDGDTAVLIGEAGQLQIKVKAKPNIPKGTIVVPHGLPGHNINRIYPSIIEPISGMHQLQGIVVKIQKEPKGFANP